VLVKVGGWCAYYGGSVLGGSLGEVVEINCPIVEVSVFL
jgi:hypothetical protein